MNRFALAALALFLAGCHGPDGTSAADHYSLGQRAEQAGDLPAAIGDYRAALQADPRHAQSLYRLGVLYADRKKYNDAAGVWERYVALEPKSAEGWNNLAQACEQSGDLARAEAAYKKGIDADPEDHSCKVNYGLMLARHGREAEGRALLLEVMKPAEADESLQAARR